MTPRRPIRPLARVRRAASFLCRALARAAAAVALAVAGSRGRRLFAWFACAALLTSSAALVLRAQHPTFSATTSIVNVNVTVLDRNGKTVDSLGIADFVLYEDGKPQTLLSCDLQHLNSQTLPPLEPPPGLQTRPAPAPRPLPPAAPPPVEAARDHRLIVLLFDFSSMQPAEQFRAEDSAVRFLNSQMTASDLVKIEVFGSSLETIADFTSDREALIAAVRKLRIGDSSELASMGDTGADAQDQSGMFTADETEFNIFNTDRKLAALESAARELGRYPEKKSLVYISSGVEKTGVDNQSQLRATVNAAVRANVSFYPIDARGLSAMAPGGDATQTGAAGNSLYSGAGQKSLMDSFQNQQETLFTLASDTGGRALLDSNDLTVGIRQVQQDVRSYYTLSYSSTNKAEDGRYRRIEVRLAPARASLRAKLEYRQGYYAPTTFAKMAGAGKEAQLQEAMASSNPVTDLPIAVEVDYFRMARGKYFVPLAVKFPGSSLAFRSKGRKAATELDFIAEVHDAKSKPVAVVRDTIPLKLDEQTAGAVGRRQVQYDTGFTLIPGKYRLQVVARENGEGKIGTFETPFTVPDLDSASTLRLSSLIVSNQRQSLKEQIAAAKIGKKVIDQDPLIDSAGRKLAPNVTRLFRDGQSLYAYLEVYDPAAPAFAQTQASGFASVAATLALYHDGRKVFETPAQRVHRTLTNRDRTLGLTFETPLKNLPPGPYLCQVNVIDEFGRKFGFPRLEIVLAPASDPPTPPARSLAPAN